MSLERIEKFQKEAHAHPTIENYRRLLEERAAFLKSEEEELALLNEREAAAQATLNRIQQERAAPLQLDETEKEIQKHQFLWTSVQKELAKRSAVLNNFMSNPYNCPETYLNVVASWLDNWGSFFHDIQKDLKTLKLFANSHANTLPALDELYDALDAMCRLQLSARSFIGHERRLLAMRSEVSIEAYLDHVESMEQWLRNATERCAALVSMKDCEKFMSYLTRNRDKMNEGFLALTAEAETLKPARDRRVSAGMQNCCRMWVELTLKTYEKVHEETMAAHVENEVPERCLKYLEVEGPALERFLSHTAFQQLRSREMNLKRTECQQLLESHKVLMLLAHHLVNYHSRDRVVQRSFKSLADAVNCPLTHFMLHLPAYEPYEGREENRQRLNELQEWVEVHCQKKTFMKLLDRCKVIRQMIDDYEVSLKAQSRARTHLKDIIPLTESSKF